MAVGVDVKRINQGKHKPILEINSIKTVFAKTGNVGTEEIVVCYDENITPEQEALLKRPNFAQYPTEQELSANIVENFDNPTIESEINDEAADSGAEQAAEDSKDWIVTDRAWKDNINERNRAEVPSNWESIKAKHPDTVLLTHYISDGYVVVRGEDIEALPAGLIEAGVYRNAGGQETLVFPNEKLMQCLQEMVKSGHRVALLDGNDNGVSEPTEIYGERESASRDIDTVNTRFNNELQQQIDGTLPQGHIYQLGMPSAILRSTGVPNMPIEMSATMLKKHSEATKHPFELSEVKDLVKAIQEPIAIFKYGNPEKSQNLILEVQHEGKNYLVGVHFNQERRGLVVSDIRGIFPKNNAEWLNWISQDKALYLDKQKIQALIDKQRKTLAEVEYLDLDDVANIVENFDNPTIESEINDEGGELFRDGDPDFSLKISLKISGHKRRKAAEAAFNCLYMS